MKKILQKWEIVIGLEVHAQLSTKTKMFCSCKNVYGDPPNTRTCPVCLALPGALPVTNSKAVDYALKLGLSLGCNITRESRFARKNYFYPDLPKGYQISQYDEPLCYGGSVPIRTKNGIREILLTRIHMEEDAGKLIHSENAEGTQVDLNRCGVPLLEIVSEPDISSPKEAREYLTRLKQVLEYLDICDCNMEQGKLRCDANISLRTKGAKKLGTRTEIKNMNSFRGVERALQYEIIRQSEVLDSGGEIDQVTLLWNESEQKVEVMRSKEEAHDYRYFPDPDLVPVVITDSQLENVKSNLVEMPHKKEHRLSEKFGLRTEDAIVIASDIHLANYFEEAIRLGSGTRETAKWILGEMLRSLKDEEMDIQNFPIKPDRFVELLSYVNDRVINTNTAKSIFHKMLTSDKTPREIIKDEGLAQVYKTDTVQKAIDEVMAENSMEVNRYHEGKKGLFGFFMGQVMKKTQGKSDPGVVKSLLSESLNK